MHRWRMKKSLIIYVLIIYTLTKETVIHYMYHTIINFYNHYCNSFLINVKPRVFYDMRVGMFKENTMVPHYFSKSINMTCVN